MKGFNFEKNLNHQSHAVESSIAVFEHISLVQPTETDKNYINPAFDYTTERTYPQNIRAVQEDNGVNEEIKRNSNIIDIMMETGTGKTYTYTKTIFELNKNFGIFKFIVVVPTLSIKAGTIDFLKSDSSREHFKEQYGKTLHLHIVESQKKNKNKKSFLPPAVTSFVNAGNFEKNSIQVMIINAGIINSETSGTDSDWVVKVIDVYPDEVASQPQMGGYQLMVSADIFRGRYRESLAAPKALKPDAPLVYRFVLPTANHVFLPGHRVMVQVQSSWFPLYDRNPQTFVPNIFFAQPADYRPATQRIFHAPGQASFVDLPVVK